MAWTAGFETIQLCLLIRPGFSFLADRLGSLRALRFARRQREDHGICRGKCDPAARDDGKSCQRDFGFFCIWTTITIRGGIKPFLQDGWDACFGDGLRKRFSPVYDAGNRRVCVVRLAGARFCRSTVEIRPHVGRLRCGLNFTPILAASKLLARDWALEYRQAQAPATRGISGEKTGAFIAFYDTPDAVSCHADEAGLTSRIARASGNTRPSLRLAG